ncbi:MAG: 4Fe-4S binding protein, partial [Anaeromyxobacteraceae bacterium]
PEPAPPRTVPDDLVAPAHVRFSHFEVAPPHAERHRAAPGVALGFEELNLGLDGPSEAARCFSCGTCTHCDTCMLYCPEGVIHPVAGGYRVDEEFCKGCGMCVAECPRRAMEMVLEVRAR